MRYRCVIVAIVTGAVWCGLAPAAMAVNPACNTTLTQDTTLDSNQTCNGVHGYTLASGVTLDLNGFTLSGNDTGETVGVNFDTTSGSKVKNGTIEDFDQGVVLDGAQDTKLVRVRVFSNAIGVNFFGGSGNSITKSFVNGNTGTGILAGGLGLIVSASRVSGNNLGIDVTGAAQSAVITDNVVATNVTDGVQVTLNATGTRLERNRLLGNGDSGANSDANGTKLFENQAIGNGERGIRVDADDNKLRLNRVDGNALDGIFIAAGAANATMVGNLATGNGDDGLDSNDLTSTFKNNVADDNFDLGIEAVGGTDGGGNSATGNGNPTRQCDAAIAC